MGIAATWSVLRSLGEVLVLQPADGLEDMERHDRDEKEPDQELDPEIEPTIACEQATLEVRHQHFDDEHESDPDRIPAHPFGDQRIRPLVGEEQHAERE